MSSQASDMSLGHLAANPVADQHTKEVLRKFDWAIKRVNKEHNTDDESFLTQEEVIKLIKAWEPQRDIICLYVRWARQLRRNFNLDSIATLLCLARQSGYTPVDFLRKVKTLSVRKNQKAVYGVTFHFIIPNRNDIDRDRLSKEFLGLSVTLSILQEQVTDSPGILGKNGMRQKGPRLSRPMNITIDGNNNKDHVSVLSHPNMEFHTQSSLLNRIWKSINHRWLAFYLTEHLFREQDQVQWSHRDSLVYSFQMMAPCGPGRYEFLSPLAGYCLRFHTPEAIESNRKRLKEVWNDPTSFLSFGNICLSQFSAESQSQIITRCFEDLHSNIAVNCKQISYHKDSSLHRRWTILRAYIFHFWLDSASNSVLKSTIAKATPAHNGNRKRKSDLGHDSKSAETVNNCTTTSIEPKFRQSAPPKSNIRTITSSRRPNTTSISPANMRHPAINLPDRNLGNLKYAPIPATCNDGGCKMTGISNTVWTDLRLITTEELQCFVQSYLLIHRRDGVDLLSELSPLEVYSADQLHDLVHCRLSGRAPFIPLGKVGPVVLNIGADAHSFIDTSTKSFHVARENSESFAEYFHHLPSVDQVQVLCQAIVCFGVIDSKRGVGQYRVNIGNGGQNWVNGAPCQLHGLQFNNAIEKDGTLNALEVLQSIGKITEFTWRVMCSLQNNAGDHPIAPDSLRKKLYARQLSQYLHMDPDVGFEDLTLVVSSLHPITHQVSEHKDTMNDTVAGYTRTAAFNMVMIDNNDQSPTILHLQVICNFRKVIGNYLLPFHKYLLPVSKHAREYIMRWHRSIQGVYSGKTDTVPSVYDRTSFFLDDTLEYSTVAISDNKKHKQAIVSEYILTEINVSRTLSLSMFIDPIVKLQGYLKFDQTIELALASSFLSNPFWFDWSMTTLIKRLNDSTNPYQLGLHPFYDWAHVTFEIFGTWQGGPYNRWSPCGGNKESVIQTFGAHPSATREERKCGEKRLSQVISILREHIEWINSLSTCGINPVMDMPILMLKAKNDRTIQEISRIASCQFSHFRLGILTTILSGCGLLKEGRHLRNLMYPVKGSASFKHLCCPVADYMSPQRARALGNNEMYEDVCNDGVGVVEEDQHDRFMQCLSAELGFQVYARDEIECILCESHPMRSLNCRDWFRKGISIYDCNENGEFFRRDYGRNNVWVKLQAPDRYNFAYLDTSPVKYIALDAKLSYYASNFGKELRSKRVIFKGRNSKTSGNERSFTNSYNKKQTFCHSSMQVADFYSGSEAKNGKIGSMFVLGDAEHSVEPSNCNNVEEYPAWTYLHNYLQKLPIANTQLACRMAAGCYHRDLEMNNTEVTFFPGHLDKPFVHTAWFVPLGVATFFTIISVPSSYTLSQDAESLRLFDEWMEKLSPKETRKVRDFLQDFDVQAKKYMRQESLVRLIYLNKCGSVLAFPANVCYHATITPQKPCGYPRDLFIVHPLDGLCHHD